MKTLPREPWRRSQICGHQTNIGGWSEGQPEFCGEFKKLDSPVCAVHDAELREENGGTLPRFAPGNALGLDGFYRAVVPNEFRLAWEPSRGDRPIPATEEEVKAWEASAA